MQSAPQRPKWAVREWSSIVFRNCVTLLTSAFEIRQEKSKKQKLHRVNIYLYEWISFVHCSLLHTGLKIYRVMEITSPSVDSRRLRSSRLSRLHASRLIQAIHSTLKSLKSYRGFTKFQLRRCYVSAYNKIKHVCSVCWPINKFCFITV